MITTREVMRKVQEGGNFRLANGAYLEIEKSRARDVPSSIDFQKRKRAGNYVKYQIYVKGRCVCTQLWCKNPCDQDFKAKIVALSTLNKLEFNDVRAALGVHGGVDVDVSTKTVEQVLIELQGQLQKLYEVFEDVLKDCSGCLKATASMHDSREKNPNAKCQRDENLPWIDTWPLAQENIDCSFDAEFKCVSELHWRPWVGAGYGKASVKVLVLGESDYADADMGKTDVEARSHVNADPNFIRKVIDRFGVRGERNVTINTITQLLQNFKCAWRTIAFTDVCQEAVKKNVPPTQKQMSCGAGIVGQLIKILEPDCVVCLGKKCVNFIPEWSKQFPSVRFVDVEYHPRYVMNYMRKELRQKKLKEWAERIKHEVQSKTVPLYAVEDLKKGKKAKPVGRMRNPDLPGCVVDRKTFEKLYGVKLPK